MSRRVASARAHSGPQRVQTPAEGTSQQATKTRTEPQGSQQLTEIAQAAEQPSKGSKGRGAHKEPPEPANESLGKPTTTRTETQETRPRARASSKRKSHAQPQRQQPVRNTRNKRTSPFREREFDPEKLLRKKPPAKTTTPSISEEPQVRLSSQERREFATTAGAENSIASNTEPGSISASLADLYSEAELELPEEYRAEHLDREIGLVAPFGPRILAIIRAVMKDEKIAQHRIEPENTEFVEYLESGRNVFRDPSDETDPKTHEFNILTWTLATEGPLERSVNDAVWRVDLAKCRNEHEPLFQRTILMSMIDRHRFLLNRQEERSGQDGPVVHKALPNCLDYSVERVWNCPGMPTRKFKSKQNPTPVSVTRPKPDICIGFRRESLFEKETWDNFPLDTKKLACFEGLGEAGRSRVFAFFAIEAKSKDYALRHFAARNQCLNAASVALHNLYEFFHEADHDDEFFNKVRFFSCVTTAEGIMVRIHRATRVRSARPVASQRSASSEGNGEAGSVEMPAPPFGRDAIASDYPLQFEHDEYCTISGDTFGRETVVNLFERIMLGYGVAWLFKSLETVTDILKEKFAEKGPDSDVNNYWHSQFESHKSGTATPLQSQPGPRKRKSDGHTALSSLRSSMVSDQTDPMPEDVAQGTQHTGISHDYSELGVSAEAVAASSQDRHRGAAGGTKKQRRGKNTHTN